MDASISIGLANPVVTIRGTKKYAMGLTPYCGGSSNSLVEKVAGDFRSNQWEVTYWNNILKGTVWNTPADWKFFRLVPPLPTIEDLVHGED